MTTKIKSEEISAILRKQLADFQKKSVVYEVGTVLNVGDGIARVHGLAGCMAGELVEFPSGVVGMALNLEEDNVGVAIFGDVDAVQEGDEVKRTKTITSVPVGEALTGRIVDALGVAIDGLAPIQAKESRKIEVKAPGIIQRQNV